MRMRWVPLAGALALALGLTACGSSTSSSKSSSSTAASSGSVLASGSGVCASLARSASPTGSTAGSPDLKTILRQSVLHPPRAFAFTQRTCVGPGNTVNQATVSATMQLHPTLRAALNVQSPQGTLPERLVGSAIYVRLPTIATRDGGRPWVQVSLAQAGNQAGLNLQELLSELRSADPNRSLSLLGHLRNFVPLGSVTVNGQRAFGYHATVTPQDLSSSSTLSPDLIRQLKGTLARVGASRESVTLYLSAGGSLVRAVTELASSTQGPIVSVQDTHELGTAVNVVPPPAGQTITLAGLRRVRGAG